MATIVIPCEPRVLVNGTRIAQNLLDSVAASSRPDHEVWLLLPYRAKAAAEPMLDLLRNQFRDLRTLELLTPVTDPYKLVTHMFARLHQALTYENNLNERPIIWVSERGNETFLPGAIDALDAAFFRKKCDTVAGKYFTIPLRKLLRNLSPWMGPLLCPANWPRFIPSGFLMFPCPLISGSSLIKC